jgi:hypothetical protein
VGWDRCNKSLWYDKKSPVWRELDTIDSIENASDAGETAGSWLSDRGCQAEEGIVISRIYIDNYKCFVNFEYQPGSLQLLMGANGTGKTAVFNVLHRLRKFVVAGQRTHSNFPPRTLTAWDQRPEQTFELGLKGNGGEYLYQLVIEQDRPARKNRIKSEELWFDRKTLYRFDGKEAHLFRDDGSAGPVFPFDWSQSAIATIPERKDNTLLSWFRGSLNRIFIFSPDPLRMRSQSEEEQPHPDRWLHQLPSWIRHLQLELPEASRQLNEALREGVIAGCTGFNFLRQGAREYEMKFSFGSPDSDSGRASKAYSLSLNQLSPGQRTLVALYTILHAAVGADMTLCIDEPDNYIALREIQPWLIELTDKVKDTGGQCLLISHHPELINYLAADCGMRFFRENGGPVRVQPFEWTADDAIGPAELVARGWEDRRAMPRNSGVRFTILVEDRALERFVRHVLLEMGAHRREIRVLPFPVGRGSGKQWIDREYPRQVEAYRRKRSENIALVVGTDADEVTVQQRAQRLDDALRDAGCDARTQQERIALWLPRWNIETWLLFLRGDDVDEGINYKK